MNACGLLEDLGLESMEEMLRRMTNPVRYATRADTFIWLLAAAEIFSSTFSPREAENDRCLAGIRLNSH